MISFSNNNSTTTTEYNDMAAGTAVANKKVTAWFNKRHFEYVVNDNVQVQKQAGYIATFYPTTMTIKFELEY